MTELDELVLNDLKRSGLDKKDIKKMGLVACDKEQASAVLNSVFSTFGYVLPYFDVDGKQSDSIRFRFLSELLGRNDKVVKYSQPKGTTARLYFPPCIKWPKILKGTTTLTFTEGEKKAYKACKMGIPTIGLGGVWSFKSKRLRKNLIDDFDHIQLKGRKVYLCFDNDTRTNDEVLKALHAFAKELYNKGASVFIKNLPFDPYRKIGLDDYLLTHDKDDYEGLDEDELDELSNLSELDMEIAYIRDVGKIYVMEDGLFVGNTNLVNLVFANRISVGSEGGVVKTAQQWLDWPNRRTYKRLTYAPAQPRVTADNEYNLWNGWGCEPRQGSIKPFTHVVDKIFGGDKDLIKWFMDWVAYPIQHPSAKMLSAVLLQSTEQGTGKSSIGEAIGSMYGDNFSVVENDQLKSSFNEWAINKQFVLGDEILGSDRRSESDRIKNLITRNKITINKKYMPTYEIPDCINYLFTSNHTDALNIEPDDRRMFVVSVENGNGISLAEGAKLERFRKGHGKSYLLNYFINEHVISKGFDHRARPPMTAAKHELIDHSLTDIERFLEHVKLNPEFALSIDGVEIDRDLFTTSQIINIYQRSFPKSNTTTTAMGKAMNKIFSGSAQRVIRTLSGTHKVRALRNVEKWAAAGHSELADHYDRSKIALFESRKKKFKS